jgi:uncharacterized protein YcbX
MVVGRVTEIWRYPVKSMGGERLEACTLGPRGIPGDRGWAVRDEAAGEVRGAKKLPELLRCAARYVEEPGDGPIPPAEITLPDGARIRSDAREAGERIGALVGRRVTLWPLRPADDADHYRRGLPDKPDLEAELRDVFGRLPDEPLPDLSVFPQELFVYTSIPGTYFDALPVHVLTTATMRALARANGGSRFDVRRFRPNFVVEPEGDATDGFVENAWSGRALRLGAAIVNVEMPTARCVMTTLPQGDLPKDPAVLRTIVRDARQNVGMYASVETPGRIAVGDRVELVSLQAREA